MHHWGGVRGWKLFVSVTKLPSHLIIRQPRSTAPIQERKVGDGMRIETTASYLQP
jgi:hypothetical protein